MDREDGRDGLLHSSVSEGEEAAEGVMQGRMSSGGRNGLPAKAMTQ